jgi:hypothetical protein
MAYSYQTGALRRKEHTERTNFEYGKILSAEAKRKKEASEKAAQAAVYLKAGETVHDLLQKGYHRKTKSVMEQDYFKDTQIGVDDDAINLFTKGKTSDIPGSDLLIPNTPQVNPSAYESLGRKLTTANPNKRWGIVGADLESPGVHHGSPKNVGDASRMNMDESVWHTKIGEKYSKQITRSSKGLKDLNIEGYTGTESVSSAVDLNLTDELIESAGSLVEGELKLATEMGTWGKVGKALGPVGSVLAIGGGIKTLADPDAEAGDKVAGAASVVGGTMTLGGAAASAGLIGGVSTGGAVAGIGGVGLGAGAAGGATLAGVGVSNFWNPVGWGIGIGAGLYGIGKGTGLF